MIKEIAMLARSTDIRRAMERLKGFMLGIAIDGRINDKEIQSLKDWLSIHPTLSAKEPFLTVSVTLHRIFEDNYIDEEEREEILELCGMFDDDWTLHKAPSSADFAAAYQRAPDAE